MITFKSAIGTTLMMTALLAMLTGCNKPEGPAEQAGKGVDNAMENAGNSIEHAKENLQR